MTNRYKLVSALTQWDQKQEARKCGHNPYFLGIAFRQIEDLPEDLPLRETILTRFNGPLVAFLLKKVGEAPLIDAEYRRIR